MDPAALARELETFLTGAPNAIVVEEGEVLFDLRSARFSISGDRGKCLLHLWSEERNTVRRISAVEHKKDVLCLTAHRFAQSKPHKLEICRDRDRRTPTARKLTRERYQRRLARVLERNSPDWTLDELTSAVDLERSFGGIYARGLLRKGRSAFAIIGVNADELQSSVDNALTFGLLWLERCREKEAGRSVVEGLRLFAPPRTSEVLCTRAACLNRSAAKLEVVELNEKEETLATLDLSDRGNITTRLVRATDERAVHERFAAEIAAVREAVPECELIVLSPTELAFRIHGLEFARARIAQRPGSFDRAHEVVFGTGAYERQLDDEETPLFRELTRRLAAARQPGGDTRDPLWRMTPERWLESEVMRKVTALSPALEQRFVYSQVPAFSAADRAMIDVLTCTRDGRLVVIELKADEDIHLPLQGLDYWSRVRWHQQRGEFQQFGYFLDDRGKPLALSSEPPLLMLVAPVLHVHPTFDTITRYFSPEVEWELIGLDEHWRDELKVTFRKRRGAAAAR